VSDDGSATFVSAGEEVDEEELWADAKWEESEILRW
jgi:hypothetical protein